MPIRRRSPSARAGVDLRRLLWVRCGGRRDVALRATDLLVRCPGFALIGLDVGESPPRLPLAGAFRLKLAVRRSGAALLILGARRIAGAAAALALETARENLAWSGPGPTPTRLARICAERAGCGGPGRARLSGRREPLRLRWCRTRGGRGGACRAWARERPSRS
jgi:hypothetical protein